MRVEDWDICSKLSKRLNFVSFEDFLVSFSDSLMDFWILSACLHLIGELRRTIFLVILSPLGAPLPPIIFYFDKLKDKKSVTFENYPFINSNKCT